MTYKLSNLACSVTLLLMLGGAAVFAASEADDSSVTSGPDKETKRSRPDDKGNKRGKHPMRPVDHLDAFKQADENGDGFLNLDEFSKMPRLARIEQEKRARLFNFLDKNNDGKLHHHEIHPSDHGRFGKLIASFRRLDSDRSGGLSLSEIKAAPLFKKMDAEQLGKMFRRLDRNSDGEIQRSEIVHAGKQDHRPTFDFAKHDTDGSGGLSFEEYSSLPLMNRVAEERRRKIFNRIDVDNNQELSPKEIKRARHSGMRGRGHEDNKHRDKRKPFPPRDGPRGGGRIF